MVFRQSQGRETFKITLKTGKFEKKRSAPPPKKRYFYKIGWQLVPQKTQNDNWACKKSFETIITQG